MVASLTWLDHDPAARARSLEILGLFQAKDSRDELGLGAIRDSIADRLFPGTSTIQTRLRYMLIVPWLYSRLEQRPGQTRLFGEAAEREERDLVAVLLQGADSAGAFGRTAGTRIKRLPSSVYWAGLQRWGIRWMPDSQDQYHRRIGDVLQLRLNSEKQARARDARREDLLPPPRASITWHPRLPPAPPGFPHELDFSLTANEAHFLLDQLRTTCGDSLLTYLASQAEPVDVEAPWEHPLLHNFPEAHQELLHHAKLFSMTMQGAALVYNYALSRLDGRDQDATEYENLLTAWQSDLPIVQVRNWDLARFWVLVHDPSHAITRATREFVARWIHFVLAAPTQIIDAAPVALVQQREMRLKGSRSRFTNKRALEQWRGASGINRMLFRWPTAKILLRDLHAGLERGPLC